MNAISESWIILNSQIKKLILKNIQNLLLYGFYFDKVFDLNLNKEKIIFNDVKVKIIHEKKLVAKIFDVI